MLALKLVRLCHAWAESRRQKHSKGERRADPRDSGNVNLGVFAGEFAHALAAGAARRDQGIAFPDDKYFGDAPLTGGDHGGYRSGFRASANGIGGILDIRPGENRARDGAKSRFNGKPNKERRRSIVLWPPPKKALRSNPSGHFPIRRGRCPLEQLYTLVSPTSPRLERRTFRLNRRDSG
jgi:hypothetical protein